MELFNIGSGWNVEALAADDGLLETLGGGWSVEDEEGMMADMTLADFMDEEEEEEEEDDFDAMEEDEEEEEAEAAALLDPKLAPLLIPRGITRAGRPRQPKPLGRAERDLLLSLQPHVLRQLADMQREANAENARLAPEEQKRERARVKTHKQLRVISGSAAGRRLISPQGDQTRPMMEMVRGAVFNMVGALCGSTGVSVCISGGVEVEGRFARL